MMLRDLSLRLRALVFRRRVERELDEELAFHIDREAEKLMAGGASRAEARAQARARFGPVPLVADQCRDARGTALIETLRRDVAYAGRACRRAPLAALTVVVTIALGLGLITAAFTVYNAFFLRADAVRNPDELFVVYRRPTPGARIWLPFLLREQELLRRDPGVFTDAVALVRDVGARSDDRAVNGALVSGNFFDVLGATATLGRTLNPADDEPTAGRPVMVLSHRGWTRLFGGDRAAIGRQLAVNGRPYEVVGVMPAEFRGLGIAPPDYWAPVSLVGRFLPAYTAKEDESVVEVVGRLRPGVTPAAAGATLTAWASGRMDLRKAPGFEHQSLELSPNPGTLSAGTYRFLLLPIGAAFGLTLLIGCANVANMLLARGVSRQREIGIRLSVGASRGRIVSQLMIESLMLALAAAACGLAASRLLLDGALYVATTFMPPEIIDRVSVAPMPVDWRVMLFLTTGVVVSVLFFGLLPAVHATRLDMVRTMRGDLLRDVRPGRVKQALIALQVGAAALLLIFSALFLRGAVSAATVNGGLRTRDTVMVPLANEPLRATMVQEVVTDPAVAQAASMWPGLRAPKGLAVAEALEPRAADQKKSASGVQGRANASYQYVSPEFFSVLGIDVLRGRSFTESENTPETGVVVVSEWFARRLWREQDAVGQMVRFQTDPLPAAGSDRTSPHTYVVIGVVRDIGNMGFDSAGVYVPIGVESPGTSLVLRVRGDPEEARRSLLDRLTRLDAAQGDITTLRTAFGGQALILWVAFWIAVVLGGLALVLTMSGLFSVLSYMVEQRRSEIGVRMALGARVRDVAGSVLGQLLLPVGVGLMVGVCLAVTAAKVLVASIRWLTGGFLLVFDPVAYGVSLLAIVTACVLAGAVPALRAARIDPMATLRED